jgi:hypothetical protein
MNTNIVRNDGMCVGPGPRRRRTTMRTAAPFNLSSR